MGQKTLAKTLLVAGTASNIPPRVLNVQDQVSSALACGSSTAFAASLSAVRLRDGQASFAFSYGGFAVVIRTLTWDAAI